MILEFELPAATYSNNQIVRMHWAARRRAKIAIGWVVKAKTAGLDWLEPPPDLVAVDILRIGPKLLDKDNLFGGAKLLIDAIVDAGLVLDDSPAHIDLTVRGEIGTPPRTRVRLETPERGVRGYRANRRRGPDVTSRQPVGRGNRELRERLEDIAEAILRQ